MKGKAHHAHSHHHHHHHHHKHKRISAATRKVDVRKGPPGFSWSYIPSRIAVFLVWSITPLSWLYVGWRTLAWRFPGKLPLPVQIPAPDLFGHKKYVHGALLAYASCEVVFTVYYYLLARAAQKMPRIPGYNRAFLRQTLSHALEDGMKWEDPKAHEEDPKHTHRRHRRPTFSRARFSQLSFLDKAQALSHNDPRAVEWRAMFKDWFLGTPWDALKRDNVLEWLAWSFYSMHYEDIIKEWIDEGQPPLPHTVHDADDIFHESDADHDAAGKLHFLYHGLYMLEARAGQELPPGKNEKVKCIRLHLDPVRITSRPLLLYLLTGTFNFLLTSRLKADGFIGVNDHGLEYAIRMPSTWRPGNPDKHPVLFVHGLGMGLAQYASLVSYFEHHEKLRDRPLILLVQPHLSMALFHRLHRKPPTKEATTRGLRALVDRWGFHDGIDVVSHSNGTIVHGWLLKDCPDIVKRSCIVDPVAFCLWEPAVAYNFLYRVPTQGIEVLMRYFVGEELGIANMLQRHFDWAANILWFEEIPNALDPQKTMIILAEKDAILNAPRVAMYLKRRGMQFVEDGGNLKYLKGKAHGEMLIGGGNELAELVDWLTHSTGEHSGDNTPDLSSTETD